MKRFFYVFSLVFISISLIGCMEVFQYITVEGDKVKMTMNVTLSKAVMEMAESMGEAFSDSDMEMDETFLDYDDYEKVDEKEFASIFPYEVGIYIVNTPTDFGYNISASLEKEDMKDLNYEEYPYLPIKKGKSYYMSMSMSMNMNFEDMLTYRHRLVVSKTYIKNIKKVVIILDDESIDIGFYDLGDAYLIDIPVLELDLDDVVLKIN